MSPATIASLTEVRSAASSCRNCALWRDATQTVFGEGRADAPMMLVGEQPGDQEDRAGRPFVGPAGRVLEDALNAAGIIRDDVCLTNAVKHVQVAGQRQAPHPRRGRPITGTELADYVVATAHPSSILRIEDDGERAAAAWRLARESRSTWALLR